MFCKNCGKEIDDKAAVCIHCGVATGNSSIGNAPVDNPSHFAGIISCCFPVVGLILYFIWKDEKPNSSKLVCKWMIGGTIGWVAVYVLFILLGVAGSMASRY